MLWYSSFLTIGIYVTFAHFCITFSGKLRVVDKKVVLSYTIPLFRYSINKLIGCTNEGLISFYINQRDMGFKCYHTAIVRLFDIRKIFLDTEKY